MEIKEISKKYFILEVDEEELVILQDVLQDIIDIANKSTDNRYRMGLQKIVKLRDVIYDEL